MRFTKWGFGGIGPFTCDIEIPLEELGDAPIVAIVGPNGIGKTMFIETSPGTFYCDTPSRGPIARLANRRDSFTEITIMVGDQEIEARLLINGHKKNPSTEAYLTVDGTPVCEGKVKEYKAAISERLPDKALYLASGFAAQGGAGGFLEIDKAERKAMFVRLLGQGRLELLAKMAGEQLGKIKAELAGKRAALDGSRELAGDVAAIAVEVANWGEAAARARETVEALEARAAEYETSLGEWNAGARRWGGVVGTATSCVQDAKARLSTGGLRVKQLETEAHRIAQDGEEVARQLATRPGLEARVAGAETAREGLAAVEETIAEMTAEAEAYREELAGWQEKRSKAEAAYRTAKAAWDLDQQKARGDVKRASSEVELLTDAAGDLDRVPCGGEGGFAGCPLIAAAVAAGPKLTTARGILADAEALLEAVKTEPVAVSDAVAAGRLVGDAPVKRDHQPLGPLETAKKAAKNEILIASEAAGRLEALGAVEERLRQLEKDGARALEELGEATAEIPPLTAAVETLEGELLAAKALEADHAGDKPKADHVEALTDARVIATDAGVALAGVEERLAGAVKAAETTTATQAAIDALVVELDDWAELRRALGPDGIQALEIDAAGPDVSDLVNELLHSCYGPRFSASLETTDTLSTGKGTKEIFDLRVIDTERGTDGSASQLSGGERVIVAEALGLAIAIYNARRSEIPIEDLFRDECAGALSSSNAVRYVEMLRKAIEVGGFHRIFFIAHQPHLWPLADARIYFDGDGCRVVDEVPEVA